VADALDHGHKIALGLGDARLDAYGSVMYLKNASVVP